MRSRSFNTNIFLIILLLLGISTIATYMAAASVDEGISGLLVSRLAKLFIILRFPTHTLFEDLFVNNGSFFFCTGLVINCMLYALVIERIFASLKQTSSNEGR